ncbi:hypothetical protein JCM8547_006563 [Rhodosporidiobolus lusitaniae]
MSGLHGLFLPHASNSDTLPSLPSSSSSSSVPALPARQPPPSFAQVRQQARTLRGEGKSPFVPRKSPGKERDLASLSPDQLAAMLERNARLLESPETFASLPGGDERLRAQQARIQSRLQELKDVSQIKSELDATHLREMTSGRRESSGGASGVGVKKEQEEEEVEDEGGEMEDVEEGQVPDEASSPLAKRRIVAQLLSRSPGSLTSPLSLHESLALQRQAVDRDRDAQVRKAAQMELDAQRPEKTGELLKRAVGVDSALGEFMFHVDSDEEPDDAEIEDWLNEGRRTANGQLNEEEDEQLNPLRTAYMKGWNKAIEEEGNGS